MSTLAVHAAQLEELAVVLPLPVLAHLRVNDALIATLDGPTLRFVRTDDPTIGHHEWRTLTLLDDRVELNDRMLEAIGAVKGGTRTLYFQLEHARRVSVHAVDPTQLIEERAPVVAEIADPEAVEEATQIAAEAVEQPIEERAPVVAEEPVVDLVDEEPVDELAPAKPDVLQVFDELVDGSDALPALEDPAPATFQARSWAPVPPGFFRAGDDLVVRSSAVQAYRGHELGCWIYVADHALVAEISPRDLPSLMADADLRAEVHRDDLRFVSPSPEYRPSEPPIPVEATPFAHLAEEIHRQRTTVHQRGAAARAALIPLIAAATRGAAAMAAAKAWDAYNEGYELDGELEKAWLEYLRCRQSCDVGFLLCDTASMLRAAEAVRTPAPDPAPADAPSAEAVDAPAVSEETPTDHAPETEAVSPSEGS